MKSTDLTRACDIEGPLLLLRRLAAKRSTAIHKFMPLDEYGRLTEPNDVAQVYWMEIVQRAHAGSLLALLRTERWLSALLASVDAGNFLSFAASYRGLLESAADIRYALGDVPLALASTFTAVHCALLGELDTMVLAPDLENDLIHFSHARKHSKRDEPLPNHSAKTMQAYLDALEGEKIGPLHDCYAELCNITHPAADSLFYFLDDTKDNSIAFSVDPDGPAIERFVDRASTVLTFAVSESVSYPIATLKILNALGIPQLHSSLVDGVDMTGHELWSSLEPLLIPWKHKS